MHIGLDPRNPVVTVSDQVKFKPACSATETSLNLEILHVASLIFQIVSDKVTDLTASMHMLVCTFVVQIQQCRVFSCHSCNGCEN